MQIIEFNNWIQIGFKIGIIGWINVIGDSDVGDIVMLVTLWWWLILDVGGTIIILATFFVMLTIFSMY